MRGRRGPRCANIWIVSLAGFITLVFDETYKLIIAHLFFIIQPKRNSRSHADV